MRYSIGLDIGIASVGYAVIGLDGNDEPCGIVDAGCRIFDAAENPKDGASLALPRREARSARRRLRRHRHRLERIRQLLTEQQILTASELDTLFGGQLKDVYALRTQALDELIGPVELARVLIHLAQRRGFKSNRKADATDKEAGKLLTAVEANAQRMRDGNYRTVGEMLYRDSVFIDQKRNHDESYLTTVQRDMIANEAKLILETQRKLGNNKIDDDFISKYLNILVSQRSFDEGPGGNSPYGGNQIVNMVGKCTLLGNEGELRAAKATYSFELFNLMQKINTIRIIHDGASISLSDEQRREIVALAHKSPGLNFSTIRKKLDIPSDCTFNCVYYCDDVEASEKKETLGCLKSYHEMRKALDKVSKDRIMMLNKDKRNLIGTVLSMYKDDTAVRRELAAGSIENADIEALLMIGGFSKFGHLSIRACDMLIPYLEQGLQYNEACDAAGLNFKAHGNGEKSRLLPATTDDMDSITSPVVRRAVAQTIKVINAIIRAQDESPVFVNIELAREMSKTKDERNKDEREMKDNAARNERIMERIRTELGVASPSGDDLVKLKLYEEQGGVCMYSQRPIAIERLFEPGYVEVDHIVPYSLCFDNGYKNKVLVFADENRHKGNRLPLEYLDGKRRDDFTVWVNTQVRDPKKKQRLLKERITDDDRKKFKERNLQDTKTMSRFLLNYINDYLAFAESTSGRIKRVTAVNGAVTDMMRKRWGISKVRADGDLHHAVDAVVIACTTDKLIQRMSRQSELREIKYLMADGKSHAVDMSTGEILGEFPMPWNNFRAELLARMSEEPSEQISSLDLPFYDNFDKAALKPIFVSRMPRRKVTGPAHKDTVKSTKSCEPGRVAVKHPLTDLKLDDNGELKDYCNEAKVSDRLLYDALKERLSMFGGVAKEAFEQPFYKPKADGTPGPRVKKVKLTEVSKLNVSIHQGTAVADNGSMVRIDVFHVDNDGYYFIPIYVSDTVKPQLPNRAVVQKKPYDKWKVMSDNDFIFSLYPNDLIRVTHEKGLMLTKVNAESKRPASYEVKNEMLYYNSADSSTASINVFNHDHSYKIKGLGIKTLEKLEKYQVDMLGNYTKVGKEKRQTFSKE